MAWNCCAHHALSSVQQAAGTSVLHAFLNMLHAYNMSGGSTTNWQKLLSHAMCCMQRSQPVSHQLVTAGACIQKYSGDSEWIVLNGCGHVHTLRFAQALINAGSFHVLDPEGGQPLAGLV